MKALRLPFWLFVVPTVVAAVDPARFNYDRAAIMQGEWWRLWTGHWVHFSVSHACWNLLVLGIATPWLERHGPGSTLRMAGLGAPLISVGLLVGAPDMALYGGLSGLAVGALMLAVLGQRHSDRPRRGWWNAALLLIIGKIATEGVTAAPLFSSWTSDSYHVSTAAHVLGFVAGIASFLATGRSRAAPLSHPPATAAVRPPAGSAPSHSDRLSAAPSGG